MSGRYRPKLTLRRKPLDTVVEVVALIGVMLCFLIVALAWSSLPETIPRHFDLSGEPDAWTGKGMLLFMPALVAVLYLGLTVAGRFPHWFNYPVSLTEKNATAQYRIAVSLLRWIKLEMTCVFAIDGWITVRSATQPDFAPEFILMVVMVVCIALTVIIHLLAALRAR